LSSYRAIFNKTRLAIVCPSWHRFIEDGHLHTSHSAARLHATNRRLGHSTNSFQRHRDRGFCEVCRPREILGLGLDLWFSRQRYLSRFLDLGELRERNKVPRYSIRWRANSSQGLGRRLERLHGTLQFHAIQLPHDAPLRRRLHSTSPRFVGRRWW
jgi:hypothetical protein